MADIKLTEAADEVTQPAASSNDWNNYFGLGGNDRFRLYQGTVIGGAGDDRIEKIPTADWWRNVQAAYWDSPAGVRVDLATGTAEDGFGGHDVLIGVSDAAGSSHDDWFQGNADANHFWPGSGNDTVLGGAGIDTVSLPWFEPAPGVAWRAVHADEIDIQVSVDGRSAVVKPLTGKGFAYTLTDVENLQVETATPGVFVSLSLADQIRPQDMAEQAIAAGGSLRWNANAAPGGVVSLTYSFVTQAPAEGVGAAGFRAFTQAEQQAVRGILASASALAGISFTEVAEVGASVGQLRFGVSSQASTKGVSWLPNQPGAGELAGDVWMDTDSMLQLAPGSEGYAALLHEIGHALGLRHPRNLDASDAWTVQLRETDDRSALTVMSETASAGGLFRSDWGALDVLALRYLYGPRAINAGDSVYVLGPREASAETTLVDDGGRDTLDASAMAAGVVLDLRPGRISSVGLTAAGAAAVDNLTIAASTLIENAVGTPFDDVLTGNEAANSLTGGLGNDWIDGGAGIDTAVFSGLRSDYELSNSYGMVYVRARDGKSGFDSLVNVERLQFADQLVSLAPAALGSDARASVDMGSVVTSQLPAPTDVERSAVAYSLVGAPAHGTAILSAQGQLTYTPAAGYHGADVLAYDITGAAGSNRYQVYLSVQAAANSAPVAGAGEYLAIGAATLAASLPPATDADRDPITYSLLASPSHGTASVAANGSFTYQAQAGYSGSDSFWFAVSDDQGGSTNHQVKLTVAAVDHLLSGTAQADNLPAAATSDGYLLLGGNDRVSGGPGNDAIDGGEGRDTAIYSGARVGFTVAASGGRWTVTDRSGAEGTDQLASVERLQFADRLVALDMGSDGHGGQAAQVLRALFGPSALKNAEFAGYGVALLDQGMSYADLVALAVHTDAFWSLAGDPGQHSNSAFVKAVYQNLTGATPGAEDLRYFTSLLDSGQFTQASLGVLASQAGLNTESADLMGLAAQGLDYIVPAGLG